MVGCVGCTGNRRSQANDGQLPQSPLQADEEEEHRRWQEMVAKIKAENAPLHPRRSRFEERYETAAPELQSMRLRPAFWEPPDNMLERQASAHGCLGFKI